MWPRGARPSGTRAPLATGAGELLKSACVFVKVSTPTVDSWHHMSYVNLSAGRWRPVLFPTRVDPAGRPPSAAGH
eukprot:4549846-Pyramimonas_sp.AAC.1